MEMHKLKMDILQDVKFILMKRLFSYIFFIFIAISCGVPRKNFTYNKSYYTYKIHKIKPKSKNIGKVVVFMKFSYLNKNISKNPTWIEFNCKKYRSDSDTFGIIYDNKILGFDLRSNISSFGCFSIDIKPIRLIKNDSIVFNVHFAEDDRPISDCL